MTKITTPDQAKAEVEKFIKMGLEAIHWDHLTVEIDENEVGFFGQRIGVYVEEIEEGQFLYTPFTTSEFPGSYDEPPCVDINMSDDDSTPIPSHAVQQMLEWLVKDQLSNVFTSYAEEQQYLREKENSDGSTIRFTP